MVTETDAINTVEFKDYFVILPALQLWDVKDFTAAFNGAVCPDSFCYNSGTNTDWISVEQIRNLIQMHVDPGFKIH